MTIFHESVLILITGVEIILRVRIQRENNLYTCWIFKMTCLNFELKFFSHAKGGVDSGQLCDTIIIICIRGATYPLRKGAGVRCISISE